MTLTELLARENLVGRTVELHDAGKYAYWGVISAAAKKCETVCLALSDVIQAFEGGRGFGRARHIPGFVLKLGETTPVRLDEKTHHFTLPDGGRGYIHAPGREPPKPAKEEEDD